MLVDATFHTEEQKTTDADNEFLNAAATDVKGAIKVESMDSVRASDLGEAFDKNVGKDAAGDKKAFTRLIRKSMRGDEAAFVTLLEQYVKEIYYLAHILLDNKAEADDVVQEVAIALYKGMQKLESPYAFSSFLFATVRNICMYHNRQHMKRKHDSIEENELDILDDEKYTPEAISNAGSLSEAVRSLVQQLPEKQRLSILLYYYYDLSYKEIAEVTENTVSAVGTSINKAKKALNKMVDDYKKKYGNDGVFHSVAIAPLLAVAFSEEFKGALTDEVASKFVGKATNSIHQANQEALAQEAATETATALSTKIIAASLGVILIAGVGAPVALSQMQPTQIEPPAPIEETVVKPFAPEVEITVGETLSADMSAGQVPELKSLHYPAYAEIQTSQGAPDSWRILTEGEETVVTEGSGARIGADTFATLSAGSYRIEWLVKGEQDQQGTAERVITIY